MSGVSAVELVLPTGGRPIAEPGGLSCSMLGGMGGSSLSRAEFLKTSRPKATQGPCRAKLHTYPFSEPS